MPPENLLPADLLHFPRRLASLEFHPSRDGVRGMPFALLSERRHRSQETGCELDLTAPRGSIMKLESLRDLLVEQLQDLYDAENRIIKALPKMAKAATSPELEGGL